MAVPCTVLLPCRGRLAGLRHTGCDRQKLRCSQRVAVTAAVDRATSGASCRQHVLKRALAAAVVATSLHFGGPALADLQTVAPQSVTELAKPLPQQAVPKRRVWLLFLGGAAALFGFAVSLEYNEALFPAIAKARNAKAQRKLDQLQQQDAQAPQEEDEASIIEVEREVDARLQGPVVEGLREASQKQRAGPSKQAENSVPTESVHDGLASADSASISNAEEEHDDAAAAISTPGRKGESVRHAPGEANSSGGARTAELSTPVGS